VRNLRIIFALTLAPLILPAQTGPVVTSVANAASNVAAQLPNSGVAQGSLFVAKGANLGPASIVVATTFPLSTSIGGTSIKITVGGVTRDGIMFYSSANQVAAILPSSVPTGAGTFTVTYNGATSAAFPVTVVRSTIGVFTLNTSGGGDAIATLGSGFVGPLNAANPGDIVAFWATGLGPVSGDESLPAIQSDMTSVPLDAWVAGKPARVLFRGRNGCCSSVDVIYLEIPQGVGGCITPVVFKTGEFVSNTTSIPTAPSGRACTPTITSATASDISTFLSKERTSIGVIGLFRGGGVVGAELGQAADGWAKVFGWFNPLPGGLGGLSWDVPHSGSCMVYTGTQGIGASLSSGLLDASSATTVTGPAGVRVLPGVPVGGGVLDFGGNFIRPGQYTISAPASREVGPINETVTFAEPIQWTNQSSIGANVDRNAGVTLEWTGGDPNGYAQIEGYTTSATTPPVGATFRCIAPISAGRFTVPSYVTQALPAGVPSTPPVVPAAFPSSLWLNGVKVTRFQVTGVDNAIVSMWTALGRTVNYTGTR
jgi:uncharacterized protein (TIGR03437 family)